MARFGIQGTDMPGREYLSDDEVAAIADYVVEQEARGGWRRSWAPARHSDPRRLRVAPVGARLQNWPSMVLHFLIRGRVQGVGFRWFVHREASELDLRGWVRNTEDGDVEVVASGSVEDLAELRSSLRRGPRAPASTSSSSITWRNPKAPTSIRSASKGRGEKGRDQGLGTRFGFVARILHQHRRTGHDVEADTLLAGGMERYP